MTWEQWQAALASRTHPRRLMTLEEMADEGLRGVRQGERHDRNDRESDDGQSRRLKGEER